MSKVLVIHGPNLNALGTRDTDVYGTTTLAEIDEGLVAEGRSLGIEVESRQTNHEGQIVDWLHEAAASVDGIVINPGAFTHTSRAIADAIRSIDVHVVEVHLSNIHAREEWRRKTVTGEAVAGTIAGFGPTSYILGLRALHQLFSANTPTVSGG